MQAHQVKEVPRLTAMPFSNFLAEKRIEQVKLKDINIQTPSKIREVQEREISQQEVPSPDCLFGRPHQGN